MNHVPTLALLLMPAAPAGAAEPGPIPHEVRLDQEGNELPDGAVVRLGRARFRLPGPQRIAYAREPDTAVAFEADGLTARDLRTGTVRWAWRLAGVTDVVVSPDGHWAVFREGRTSWVWNIQQNRRQLRLAGREVGTIGAVTFAADGRRVATADEWEGACKLRVWDLESGRMHLLGPRETPDGDLWFVDGGRRLLSRPSERHDVTCWDVAMGERAWQSDPHGQLVACPDGPYFVVESPSRGFALYTVADGKPVPCRGLAALESGWHRVLVQSADGSRIVWSDRRENGLFVGRVSPGHQELKPVRIEVAPGDFPAVALSPDGRRLLVADPRPAEFETETGRRLTPAPPEWAGADRLHDPVWTRDGRRLLARPAFPSADRPAKDRFLWAADTGRFLKRVPAAEIKGHGPATYSQRAPVSEEALSEWMFVDPPPGDEFGSFLAGIHLSGDRRFGLRVGTRETSGLPWRPVEVAFERATLRPLGLPSVGLASTLAFSPDGRTLATVQPDGVRLSDLWTGRRIRTLLPAGDSGYHAPLAHALAFSPDGRRLAVCVADGTILICDSSRTPPPAAPLRDAELDHLWIELAAPDPVVAWAAAARLADRPEQAVPFLARRLTPVAAMTDVQSRQLLADLDAPAYRTRERAMKRAAELGDAAKSMVEVALKEKTGAEVRQRLETLATALDWKHPPGPNDLRRLRALAVLEHIGTSEARAKITEVAGGLADARVTREANAAQARLLALDLAPRKH